LFELGKRAAARIVPLFDGINARIIEEFDRGFSSEGLKSVESGMLKALILAGPAPGFAGVRSGLRISISPYWDDETSAADIVLPSAAFIEEGGTYVNFEGRIQTFDAVIPPAGEAKPDRQIVSELAAAMGVSGFARADADGILKAIGEMFPVLGKASGGFIAEPSRAPRGSAPVPDGPKPPEDERKFPLKLLMRPSASYRGLDLGLEIRGLAMILKPGRILMNPTDAAAAGVSEGDTVVLESAAGVISGMAAIAEALQEGVLEMVLPLASPRPGGWTDAGIIPVEMRRKP
jgi:anaerobic selenocysteine-containing dehydrogenase